MASLKAFIQSIQKNGVRKTFQIYRKIALGVPDHREEIDTLFWFLNEYVDITKVATASGDLRKTQLSDTILLKIFDRLCEKNELIYWLNYGTLLGGIRHKGFIPWDDDLDVAMPRTDYEKMKGVLKDFAKENDFCFYVDVNPAFESLGLGYKGSSVWLDIFPIDVFRCTGSKEDAYEVFLEKLEKYRRVVLKGKNKKWDEIRIFRQKIMEDKLPINGNEYFWWYSPLCSLPILFLKKEDVLPLENRLFEEMYVNFPNNSHEYLRQIYGEQYMKFPRKGILHHSSGENLESHIEKNIQKELEKVFDNMHLEKVK